MWLLNVPTCVLLVPENSIQETKFNFHQEYFVVWEYLGPQGAGLVTEKHWLCTWTCPGKVSWCPEQWPLNAWVVCADLWLRNCGKEGIVTGVVRITNVAYRDCSLRQRSIHGRKDHRQNKEYWVIRPETFILSQKCAQEKQSPCRNRLKINLYLPGVPTVTR